MCLNLFKANFLTRNSICGLIKAIASDSMANIVSANKGKKRKLTQTTPKQLMVKAHNQSKQKKHHSGTVDLSKYIVDSKARSKTLHTRTQTLMKKVYEIFQLFFLKFIS